MEILASYPAKSENIASRIVDDEAVIVLPLERMVYTLVPVGTRIWELITGKIKLSGIVERIHNEFDIDFASAKQDIIEFINELVTKNILMLEETPNG